MNPDLLLANCRIVTFEDEKPIPGSLLIHRGRIVSIEPAESSEAAIERVDLGGGVVLPGLVDSHIHLLNYAHSFLQVDCEVGTLKECIDQVRVHCKRSPLDGWIRGHGWNQNRWTRFGRALDLDPFSPRQPIYLTAKSLHAAWVNSKALAIAGIDESTPDPEGGEIQRDEAGRPTGILFENAMQLVSRHIPPPTATEDRQALLAAQTQLHQFGLTGVHDFDGPSCFRALQSLHEDDELSLRVIKNIQVEYLPAAIELGLRAGFGDEYLRIGNIKVFMDGALGPHTAAMIKPYNGEKDNLGLLLMGSEELTEFGIQSAEAGFGLTVHAIGDRANHVTLNAFEALRKEEADRKLPHRRHRMEHLQLLHPDDVQRPSQLEIIASMQPIHATSDMIVADRFWGTRVKHSYAWRTIENTGAQLAFGSDAPVESPNPFLGIHAAVTRRRIDGSPGTDGWVPEQKIDLPTAIQAYITGPAYACGWEDRCGRLAPGFFADLLVLEVDPFTVPPDEIHAIEPIGTMVDGKWRYKNF